MVAIIGAQSVGHSLQTLATEFKMSPQYSSLFLFFISILISSLSAQNTDPTDIVVDNPVQLTSDTVFRRNMVSKVTCSADQINLDPSIIKIQNLQLRRQLLGSTTVEEIAALSPYSLFDNIERKNIPIGRQWTIDFIGVIPTTELPSVNFNTRSTKAELTMNDVRCADAGVYECVVGYSSDQGGVPTFSGQQNISSRAAIENFYVSVDPQNVGFRYSAGVNVTMSCYAEGPEDIQMSWHYLEPNSPEVLRPFVDSNIHMDQPEAKPNDECGSMKHRSEFSIQLQEAQDGYMYVCAVKDGNDIELHRNLTLSISAAAVGPGGNTGNIGTASSGSNNAGMIVGIVVGVLAFIVIVLLIVYFCWYRKRNESPKDKDAENNDTKPDMHAPPPVFYSKPNKPPKDDGDDGTLGKQSDASDTWGRKPRYDTYDDDHRDGYEGRKPSSSSTGRQRGRQGSSSSAVRDRDAYPSRSAYDDVDNGYGPRSKDDSYDSRPRYEKRRPRDTPASATDVSGRSEDEASDAPLNGSYRQKPRPKRRTSRPSSVSEDRDDRRERRGERERERDREAAERGGDPALHYAQLDLAPSAEREKGRGGRVGRKDQPVEYAEIRV